MTGQIIPIKAKPEYLPAEILSNEHGVIISKAILGYAPGFGEIRYFVDDEQGNSYGSFDHCYQAKSEAARVRLAARRDAAECREKMVSLSRQLEEITAERDALKARLAKIEGETK